MNRTENQLMTGEAARLIGVHRSTVKRWCDAEELPCSVTEGGHRRIALSTLLAFAKAHDLACPLLAFGSQETEVWQAVRHAEEQRDYADVVELAYQWLTDRDPSRMHALLQFTCEREWPLPTLFDRLVRSVMYRIGEAWRDGAIHVGDEHRMSHVMFDGMHALRSSERTGASEQKPSLPIALVGCGTGNRHEMGALMVRMVLEAEGWQTLYLGSDVPTRDFALQQVKHEADLVCISLAPPEHVASDTERMLESLARRYDSKRPYRIALGGQVVQEEDLSAGYPFTAVRAFSSLERFTQWLRAYSPQTEST